MNAESVKIAIEALPSEVRQELDRMRLAGRGLFGNATSQTIVDRHLDLLLWFRMEHQADHADLALLLHFHGISGPDDQPLTVGTVSSAISRAVRASERARVQTQAKPEPSSPAPVPARKPVALEGLDLTPAMKTPGRLAEDPEIRRADHHAQLMTLLDPSTPED